MRKQLKTENNVGNEQKPSPVEKMTSKENRNMECQNQENNCMI